MQAASTSSHSCPVPSTARAQTTGRVTGLALVHVLSTLLIHILGSALPASCHAHTHPWQLRQEWLQAQLVGDVCLGSGTPTRVQAQSCPQVPAGRVLGCPCSTGLPQPQAAPSPPSVFFLKNNISAKYFNQISSSVSAVLLNQCSPTHLGG